MNRPIDAARLQGLRNDAWRAVTIHNGQNGFVEEALLALAALCEDLLSELREASRSPRETKELSQ